MATTKKLKADLEKLRAVYDRQSTPADMKAKIKTQIDKVEAELKKVKTEKKEKPSAAVAASTQVMLGKLQKFVSKNSKKYGSYSGTSEKNLRKDAVRHALKIGKRESQGLRANQSGSKKDNKGNTYYEYRTNRHDVKQPKAKQSFPMLAKGGGVSRGGKFNVGDKVMVDDTGYVKYFSAFDTSKPATIIEKSKNKTSRGVIYFYALEMADGKKPFNNAPESMLTLANESGGYMAKGGKLKINGDDFTFLLELTDKELSKRLDLIRKQQDLNGKQYFSAKQKGDSTKKIEEARENLDNQERAIIQARIRKNKMESGGYMAKGGQILVGRFDEQQLRKKEDKVAIDKMMKESGLKYIKSKMIKQGGKPYMEVYLVKDPDDATFESGGYMENGGKLKSLYAKGGVAEHKLMVGDYIKSIVGKNDLMVINNGQVYAVDIERGTRKLMKEDGGFIDVSLDKGGAGITNIGGTAFSTADTSDMFKMGGTVKYLKHRKDR